MASGGSIRRKKRHPAEMPGIPVSHWDRAVYGTWKPLAIVRIVRIDPPRTDRRTGRDSGGNSVDSIAKEPEPGPRFPLGCKARRKAQSSRTSDYPFRIRQNEQPFPALREPVRVCARARGRWRGASFLRMPVTVAAAPAESGFRVIRARIANRGLAGVGRDGWHVDPDFGGGRGAHLCMDEVTGHRIWGCG